jgi:hypothetical protein
VVDMVVAILLVAVCLLFSLSRIVI